MDGGAPRVFVSHASGDKPTAETLATALRERGIDAWFDTWEMITGGGLVGQINDGLERCSAGVIVFSKHTRDNIWVNAEVAYLTYAYFMEGKTLVPVVHGDDAYIPPLLRALCRVRSHEHDRIADALRNRRPSAPALRPASAPQVHRVVVGIARTGDTITVRATLDGTELCALERLGLPAAVRSGRDAFLRNDIAGTRRDPQERAGSSKEHALTEFGRALGALCLTDDASQAIAQLLDGAKVGTRLDVVFESDDPELLGLPFEALRLHDGRTLALAATVVTWRRPRSMTAPPRPVLPGPIKVLVAVGAPDEARTSNVTLDLERELQNILDAVDEARSLDRFAVRVLEVGHPAEIARAFERDAWHALHLSCHGAPGKLVLEDEEGREVLVSAKDLLTPLEAHGRPLPLVFLSACHGGVLDAAQTSSLALDLLRDGVGAVVAMQTAVSDRYATELARSFYQHLSTLEPPHPSLALALARKELEQRRQQAIARGAPPEETQPEQATAALYVLGDEAPLADLGAPAEPLRDPPVHDMDGPVPQLSLGDLIGRRRELREALKTLRAPSGTYAGVQLTGIGGVGKSALAGRAMRRLAEDHRVLAVHTGRWDLLSVARSVGDALKLAGLAAKAPWVAMLSSAEADDRLRFQALGKALAELPVVLVLDDFEQNLTVDGTAFLDDELPAYLRVVFGACRRGRVLITSRHPLPGFDARLRRIDVGPLSVAETRKLLLRLPALRDLPAREVAAALVRLGGHPRLLEYLDGLLRGGHARLPAVTERLRAAMRDQGIAIGDGTTLDEARRVALLLAARDVLLDALCEAARDGGFEAVLLQVAVSNVPVSPVGVARMMEGAFPASDVLPALERLRDLSLLHRFDDGEVWVHRWTSEALRVRDDAAHRARCKRAGDYRMWRVANESRSLGDGLEAMRNYLSGGWWDEGSGVAVACIEALTRFRNTVGVAAIAAEVLSVLPEDHEGFATIADSEAQAHLALGATQTAMRRYQQLLERHEHLAQSEPDRADYQRDLSISYNRMGDLYGALGQGEQARDAYLKSLAIAERLAQSEPDRADYQRDLSISYNKMGDLYGALGQGEQARDAYLKSLAIAERLAQSEPDRADYQYDLAGALQRVASIALMEERPDDAAASYERALALSEHLKAASPDLLNARLSVANCCQLLAEVAPHRAETLRRQALDELTALEREGRLPPDQRKRLEHLRTQVEAV